MNRNTLTGKLILSYVVPCFILSLFFTFYSVRSIKTSLARETAKIAAEELVLIEQLVSQRFASNKLTSDNLQTLITTISENSNIRITVINENGTVTADSHVAPESIGKQLHLPEIQNALAGVRAPVTRYSEQFGSTTYYSAETITYDGALTAIIRIAKPASFIDEVAKEQQSLLLLSLVILTGIIIAISILFSTRFSYSLFTLNTYIERMSRLKFRIPPVLEHPVELRFLFETLGTVNSSLNGRITAIKNANKQSNTVLSSMVEPVILLNKKMQIRECNEAGCRLVDLPKDRIIGKNLLEVIRNTELHDFAQSALSSPQPIETSITIYRTSFQDTSSNGTVANPGPHLYLQVHGTVLPSKTGTLKNDGTESIDTDVPDHGDDGGVLLVFNDITKLKTLENIRKDFVANVSHELKTPITSIKGFVETLLGGAIDQPEKAEHFLDIIAKQTDRLDSIIDDLLSLSRLEQFKQRELEFEHYTISKVVNSAAYVCRKNADKKNITLQLESDEEIKGNINPLLLEQAVVNLIDNAIKYSESDNIVTISTGTDNNSVYINVKDNGCGIPSKHLSRIFERFYRIDKARSRVQGGTGLGLSIVKHIAYVHHGEVTVKSNPGEGSTFTIRLPK